jgi:hypothetical protein
MLSARRPEIATQQFQLSVWTRGTGSTQPAKTAKPRPLAGGRGFLKSKTKRLDQYSQTLKVRSR